MKATRASLMVLVVLATLSGGIASAAPSNPPGGGAYPPPKTAPAAGLNYRLLAKAQPDECFDTVGAPPACEGNEVPNKVNQAYLWGLTQSGNNLWFGTAANVVCLASALLGSTAPVLNDSYVCEYGSSQFVDPVIGYPLERRSSNCSGLVLAVGVTDDV